MLRKLVINDEIHVSSELVLEDGGRMVKLHVPVWGNFCREVRFKCKKMA